MIKSRVKREVHLREALVVVSMLKLSCIRKTEPRPYCTVLYCTVPYVHVLRKGYEQPRREPAMMMMMMGRQPYSRPSLTP
jgi:hypothetical protein